MEKHVMQAELVVIVNVMRLIKGLPSVSAVPPDTDLRGGLGLTSLDLAELTVRIEDRFGINVFASGVVRRWDELCQRVWDHVQAQG